MTIKRLLQSENGFTIVELMAAVMVLSMGVIMVVSLFDMSMITASRSKVRTVANNLAAEKIESVRNISYDDITVDNLNYQLGTYAAREKSNYTIVYDVSFVDDPADNPEWPEVDEDPEDYKLVKVTVSWTNPKPASQVVLETMINKNPVRPAGDSSDTTPPQWPAGDPLSGNPQQEPVLANHLSWIGNWATDDYGVVGYLVYHEDHSSPWVLIATIAPSIGEYTDIYYTNGEHQHYYLKAFDSAGNISAASNDVRMYGPDDTEPPTVPLNVIATALGPNEVKIEWDASTDNRLVEKYYIYRIKAGFPWQQNPLGESTSPIYFDTSVNSGTTYQYRISALDNVPNESGKSASASVTTP